MPAIVLATLNARYAHASLGLRCLRANLGALRDDSVILEFTIARPAAQVVAAILAAAPRVVGFGVYIWNVVQTTAVIELLKQAAPEVAIVVGGPEVSHEVEEQRICALADHVVTGWGDITFARLARQLLHGPRPLMKVHAGEQTPLAELQLPYDEYSDADLRHRNIYVEASRGCPFKCEFCLSALDKTAWPFPLDGFLAALARLWQRGARRFKFVDRTFNLKVATSRAILEFFLARLAAAPEDPPYVHFELIPDHLPEALKALIVRFPPGTLQFEIGIQTWNPQVQALISRRQDNAAAEDNLRWLRAHSHAHLHVDLIAGLPGEDLESFAAGFDRLQGLQPHEIQVGILKRLRGAPIDRHAATQRLDFATTPPYAVQSTAHLDAATVQRLVRFARYWELVANSGRFVATMPLILGTTPFVRFLALTDWLLAEFGRTHAIALEELHGRLLAWLVAQGEGQAQVRRALEDDYARSGARGRLPFAAVGRRGARAAALQQAVPPRQRRRLALDAA